MKHEHINDSMQVDYHLAANPIDVVTAFTTQRPCHRRKRTRVRLFTVVFVSADVATAFLAVAISRLAFRIERPRRSRKGSGGTTDKEQETVYCPLQIGSGRCGGAG
jgi:hypothetical protein